MFVIGTAGHVDHGKSSLVKALTGVDPDRLQEEKVRGMTIDLGFAELTLPDGTHAGIVDVPGHERFIKNMLAGVGGIDIALLVVAADEGVMPQTLEHLAILDLLGVEGGVVALTKSDLVDDTTLEFAMLEVQEAIASTTLAGAPIVPCSAVTGTGLRELVDALHQQMMGRDHVSASNGTPRLPVDRVFTVAGFGTVVTGTLIGGSLMVGDQVELLPPRSAARVVTARIRGLQNHGRHVESSVAGSRTAVNLGSVDTAEIDRGQVLTKGGWLKSYRVIDVRLRLITSAPHPLRHNSTVSFHHYASETAARVILPQERELLSGSEVDAQLRLSRPIPVLVGDRFVIRDAASTLGGGVILSASERIRVRRKKLLEGQQALDIQALIEAIRRRQPASVPPGQTFEGVDPSRAEEIFTLLVAEGQLYLFGTGSERVAYTADGLEQATGLILDRVGDFHAMYPLRPGLPREEMRARLALSRGAFEALMDMLEESGKLRRAGSVVALDGWLPSLSLELKAEADRYLAGLEAAPFSPDVKPPPDELLHFLVETGEVVRLPDGTVFRTSAYNRMLAMTTELLKSQGDASLAEVRDLLGTSRRYVQPFLEHLDHQRITVRRGDRRTLVS